MNETGRTLSRPHDPFDDSATQRHRRMGLLSADGKADNTAMEVFSHIYAGLFFDSLCDVSASLEAVHIICARLLDLAEDAEPRRILLAISMQYDVMRRPLPEPIWWIAGSKALLPSFSDGFLRHLDELVRESEVK